MNSQESRDIYDKYFGAQSSTPVENIDSDSQQYLDNNVIPTCKTLGVSINGIQRYLASQGITDPNYIQYIQSKIN